MERRKGNLVFPTSVYLDNLASSVSQSSSRSQASSGASSPSVSGGERGAVNMFEVRESPILEKTERLKRFKDSSDLSLFPVL